MSYLTYAKPDGDIQFGFSGCCCPPRPAGFKRAGRGGQHTNACTTWLRVNEGVWQRVERATDARVLAAAALSVKDFLEAWNKG